MRAPLVTEIEEALRRGRLIPNTQKKVGSESESVVAETAVKDQVCGPTKNESHKEVSEPEPEVLQQ